jgi:hypothetical protein
MAFVDMITELVGEMNLPEPFVETRLNEALRAIYEDPAQRMWSFQIRTGGWLTPGLLFATGLSGALQSMGIIMTKVGSDQVVGDALASAAWSNYVAPPFLTELQIRSPWYALYDIVGFDQDPNTNIVTLTLDRPWMEPDGEQPYMMYQAYFPAPVADWKRFFEVRDTSNNAWLDYWSYSQRDLSVLDAQRVQFDMPSFVVFHDCDHRPNSATYGFPRFELWPNPLSQLPYSFTYLRMGDLLVEQTDMVPEPLSEEMVKWKARESLYLFKEAQKGDGMARGSGADWRFLAGAAAAEYQRVRDRIGKRDTDIVDMYLTRMNRGVAGSRCEPFTNVLGQVNLGSW